MGNSIGGRRKGAKVMKLDGTAFRVKPPATAAGVLRDHPGFQLLESEEVKLLGVRARPLAGDAPLKPGRLYFLVELPRQAAPPRRAWSGALQVGARERLESLMLTRRSTSDISLAAAGPLPPPSPASSDAGGTVRLKMKLPRAQVAKLMEESRNSAEAAAKIMELCSALDGGSGAATPNGILRTPERSPRFAATPDWNAGFMRTPERSPVLLRTPERWPTLPRTPEYSSPDVKAGRKEKRTRFVALPDEIIA